MFLLIKHFKTGLDNLSINNIIIGNYAITIANII